MKLTSILALFLLPYLLHAHSTWDAMIWDEDNWYQRLYTQDELDQEVSTAKAEKDAIILELNEIIMSMFTEEQLNEEVAKAEAANDLVIAELNEVVNSFPHGDKSRWDTMIWDEDNWFIEFEALTSLAELWQAIQDTKAAEEIQKGYVLVDINDIIGHEEEEIDKAIVDKDGDGLTDEQEIARGTDPDKYVLQLKAGWNLLSVARVPEDNSINAILGNEINPTTVWIWEEGRFKIAKEVLPLRGHWVYTENDINDLEISIPQP